MELRGNEIPKTKEDWHLLLCDGKCGNDADGCRKYIVTKSLFRNSKIPMTKWFLTSSDLSYKNLDHQAFMNLEQVKLQMVNLVNNGTSLLIYSDNTGNGKTSWLYVLLASYLNSVWETAGFDTKGLFVNTVDFLMRLKASINTSSEDFEELHKSMYDVPLLVLDDIGVSPCSPYNQEVLYHIINHRTEQGLSTFYSTNCDPTTLQANIGKRLTSRVWNNSIRIQLQENDKRG